MLLIVDSDNSISYHIHLINSHDCLSKHNKSKLHLNLFVNNQLYIPVLWIDWVYCSFTNDNQNYWI